MRRNEEREAALDVILTDYREKCLRVYLDAALSSADRAKRYAAARKDARSEIFRVMRRDKPVTK